MFSPENKKEYNPLVSIALTTSKSEIFLREQLDSLVNQTYTNIEIVISHDECGDRTVQILDEYSEKDKRVKWEYNKLAKGYVKNTENAIAMCTGEIIFLCDHDDAWYLDRVAQHVEVYKDPSIFWVYNRLVITDENNKKEIGYLDDVIYDYYFKERMSLLNYTWGSCIGGAMTSYRADMLHSVMPIWGDALGHDVWIQLAIYPKKSFFIDKVLQTYRQHGANQVGWGKEVTEEEFKDKENRAIQGNLYQLSHLPLVAHLALWKRSFFFVVYIFKRVRQFFRRLYR